MSTSRPSSDTSPAEGKTPTTAQPEPSAATGSESDQTKVSLSRRTAIASGMGLSMASGIAGLLLGHERGQQAGASAHDVMTISYPFRGAHQPGITTSQQQQMHIAAYDVITDSRQDVIDLLTRWTLAAERLMAGQLVGEPKEFREVAPDDTGETTNLGPAALTITFGFGATLFKKDGQDRFGIAAQCPPALAVGIPRMAAEKLDPQHCYGDLIIQACAEDPMVAMHAIHNLTRLAFGTASLRWSQLGYGRTSSTSTEQHTPRNLFGFKDGTANIKAEEDEDILNEHLWIQPGDEGGAVAAGGSYLCFRKIKQMMEVWDELILSEQETIIGRDKLHGAPLSGGSEHTAPDFKKVDADGNPLIAVDSHVARVHPSHNGGRRMLRRGYNYMEGNDHLGRLKGGLFFIAFVRDPRTNFTPILQKMSTDQMTEYLQHIATGLYLIPSGVKAEETYVGQRIFEA